MIVFKIDVSNLFQLFLFDLRQLLILSHFSPHLGLLVVSQDNFLESLLVSDQILLIDQYLKELIPQVFVLIEVTEFWQLHYW